MDYDINKNNQIHSKSYRTIFTNKTNKESRGFYNMEERAYSEEGVFV